MYEFEIEIEEADKKEALEKNYKDVILSIIASISNKGGEHEQSSDISESLH